MKRIAALTVLSLMILGLLTGCLAKVPAGNGEAGSSQAAAASASAAAPGSSASLAQETRVDALGRFSTVDLNGKAFDYTMVYQNKLTMVNVWMTWCGYCVQEMPELAKLSEEYADKGFAVVGVLGDSVKSFDDNPPVRDDAATAQGLQIIAQSGAKYVNLQPDAVLSTTLRGVDGFPTTYFLDSNGALVAKIVGANSYDGWKSEIESLLGKVK